LLARARARALSLAPFLSLAMYGGRQGRTHRAERRGNNAYGIQDFYWQAKARNWPCLYVPYLFESGTRIRGCGSRGFRTQRVAPCPPVRDCLQAVPGSGFRVQEIGWRV
jgi:hypothetical protein